MPADEREAAAPSVVEHVAALLALAHMYDGPAGLAAGLAQAGLLRSDPKGTETEVEWSVFTPEFSAHERLVCVDEQDARDTVRVPTDRVQSRTITTSPWRTHE